MNDIRNMLLEKLRPIATDWPLDMALCCFKLKTGAIILGCMDWNCTRLKPIKKFGEFTYYSVDEIELYQYILNEKGGCLFVKRESTFKINES